METRDGGGHVTLSAKAATVYALDSRVLVRTSPAFSLMETSSLESVESVILNICGRSELDYERAKAQRLNERAAAMPGLETLNTVDEYAAEAAVRGADHLSIRRLVELTGATDEAATKELRQLLAVNRPERYEPPLYHARGG